MQIPMHELVSKPSVCFVVVVVVVGVVAVFHIYYSPNVAQVASDSYIYNLTAEQLFRHLNN